MITLTRCTFIFLAGSLGIWPRISYEKNNSEFLPLGCPIGFSRILLLGSMAGIFTLEVNRTHQVLQGAHLRVVNGAITPIRSGYNSSYPFIR